MDLALPPGEILEEDPTFDGFVRGPSDSTALADAFKQGMRRLAAGVCVITVEDGIGLAGITATSVTSLSMAPPSLLVSIRRTSSFYDALLRVREFTVHILGERQQHAAQAFAGRLGSAPRDSLVDWVAGRRGQKLLAGAVCHVECRVGPVMPMFSHVVVVGVVADIVPASMDAPLVYFDGDFVGLQERPAKAGG